MLPKQVHTHRSSLALVFADSATEAPIKSRVSFSDDGSEPAQKKSPATKRGVGFKEPEEKMDVDAHEGKAPSAASASSSSSGAPVHVGKLKKAKPDNEEEDDEGLASLKAVIAAKKRALEEERKRVDEEEAAAEAEIQAKLAEKRRLLEKLKAEVRVSCLPSIRLSSLTLVSFL